MTGMNERQACAWLSEARYARFRDACGGDHASAVNLYEWHAVLGMASFGLIHHFEILIRNTMDAALGQGQPQAPIKDTWLGDFDVLRPDGIRQVLSAINRLEKGGVVTRGGIVASLSFSFWADLFGRHYEDLWRQRLFLAFPHGRSSRKALGNRMRRIQRFRNRIAHHDSLLDQDVPALLSDMLEIAGWIDPCARAWIEAQTGAIEIAKQVARFRDPAPTLPR
jgi:hypothetical protein